MWHADFLRMMAHAERLVLENGVDLNPGRWQGIDTAGKPDLVTREILNFQATVPCIRHGAVNLVNVLAAEIKPNRKWADEHFEERVGGHALNPDPSHERWPHWHGQDSTTKKQGVFSHTYSERFWPAYEEGPIELRMRKGIRYPYGDYDSLVRQLMEDPLTRQAYLPIFFPEDTGAMHGGRVPCTLGYHFMQRDDKLHLWYDIRSCDIYRHMRDDVYLAVRLMLHTLELLQTMDVWLPVKPGNLYFCAHSLHIHKGDWHKVYNKPASDPGFSVKV